MIGPFHSHVSFQAQIEEVLKNLSQKASMKGTHQGQAPFSLNSSNKQQLGGGFKHFFIFTPTKIGEMIQFDEHIFQMGWNHELGMVYLPTFAIISP